MKGLTDFVCQPLIFLSAFAYMLIISWKLLAAIAACIPISFYLNEKVNKALDEHA